MQRDAHDHMTTLLLIRHATTDLVGNTIAGRMPGVHLNQEGRAQAARLAQRLATASIAAVYSSALERVEETARPVAEIHNLQVQCSAGIGEIEFGEWSGRTLHELAPLAQWQHFNSFRSGTRIPGGELMLEVQARAVAALSGMCAQHRGEIVAVVSHADVIRAAVAHYAGIHLDLFQRIEISPASVSIITVNDYGPHILRLNDTGDLNMLIRKTAEFT